MDTPEISVVIPTRNEEASIGRVIDEVSTAMRGHGPYEIIVVDTDSTDRTTEIARNKGARVVPEPRRGNGSPDKTGVAAGKGANTAGPEADPLNPARTIPAAGRDVTRTGDESSSRN